MELRCQKWPGAAELASARAVPAVRSGRFGIVPPLLDGAIVSSHYFLFSTDEAQINRRFLDYFIRTPAFRSQVEAQGSTNYAAIRPADVLGYKVPLPPLGEQRRVVARIEKLAAAVDTIRKERASQQADAQRMLRSAFDDIVRNAQRRPMRGVAPIVRRPVDVDLLKSYPELGIRSFGNGTFHKPALTGLELGSKRVYSMQPGDLVLSNIFAWEGAIAGVKPADQGRIGSHRYITCVPPADIATSRFLCFYLLTPEELDRIGTASPGGAGGNRTLGLGALGAIEVPVPPIDLQRWFEALLEETDLLSSAQAASDAEVDKLLPAVLDQAFRGDL